MVCSGNVNDDIQNYHKEWGFANNCSDGDLKKEARTALLR
jgi:hypothetical protein